MTAAPTRPAGPSSRATRTAPLGRHLPVLLVVAFACLIAGLTLPIMEVRELWVFRGTYSILGGIALLIREGEVFTGAILFAFSVLLPAAKILVLIATWGRMRRGIRPSARLPAFLEAIGKWSMLDVLVIALIVFAAKASALIDAEVALAVFPFVASIALTLYCARAIKTALAA